MMLEMLLIVIMFGVISCEEYCNSESFKPECSKNEVILIDEALYGRKNIGRCLSDAGVPDEHLMKTSGFVGCYADVRHIIESMCAGRQRCEMPVAQIDVETTCSRHFRYYLEAQHRCLKVIPETHDCKVSVESDKQHISSVQGSSCGGKTRPWKISSMAGQRINISLLQLKSDSYDQQLPKKSLYFVKGVHNNKSPCQVYAYIREESSRQMVFVCYDGNYNEEDYMAENSMHYASSSNEIDIYFENQGKGDENRTTFLVSLEATGCSDLRPPDDATWNRTGNEVIVACHRSWIRWTLKCDGNKWTGVMGNCSYAPSYIENFEKMEKAFVHSHKESGGGGGGGDQMIMVFTIIIAGLVLCLFIACIGVVFLKRYYSMNKSKQMSTTMGSNPTYNNNSTIMQTANKAYYEAQMRNNNNNMSHNASTDKQEEGFFAENSQLNQDTAQYFELDQALVGKEAPAMA